jgi:DNA primase
VEEVILCFDSDNAGQNAAVRSLDSLLASGLAVRVATVPPPHDPDSFIKESGGAAFVDLIDNARGFFDYYLDRLCSLHDPATDRGRRAIVQGMAEVLNKTGNEVLRDTYAQKTALRLGVAADAMRQEFKKMARAPAVQPEETDQPVQVREEQAPRPTQHELWLLRVLLESNDHVDWVAAHLDTLWLPTATARQIVAARLRLGHDWPGAAAWLSQPENTPWQSLVSEVLADNRPIPDPQTLVQGSATREGIVKILRDKYISSRMAELNLKLTAPDVAESAFAALEAEIQALRQLRQQPLAGNIQKS